MGRKSKAKRIAREIVEKEETDTKAEHADKKSAKKISVRKIAREKAEKYKDKIKIHRKAIFGAILTIIMLSILVSVGYLLFQKAFSAQPIAKLLPADHVAASLELNINFDHSQTVKAFQLLDNYENFSKENLLTFIETKMALPASEKEDLWRGRNFGTVILETQQDNLVPIYFLETYDKDSTIKEINLQNKETFFEYSIYQNEGALTYAFIGDYLFAAEIPDAIKDLVFYQTEKKLYSSAEYRRIDDNMPLNKLGFLYVNFEKADERLFQQFNFLDEAGLITNLKPFFKFFDASGMAIVAAENEFKIQSFLSLKAENLDNAKYVTFQEKYNAALTAYLGQDIYAVWGGKNLESQAKRLVEMMADADPNALNAFDTLMENYTKKYLGPDISFTEDVLPLLKNEFAVSMEPVDDDYTYKLVLMLSDPVTDAVNIHKIADSFATVGAVFEPKVVTHELPDGTMSKEIIAEPKTIVREESQHEGVTIYEMVVENDDWGVYYGIMDNVAIIALDKTLVEKSIDYAKGKAENLKQNPVFTSQMLPVMENADEITYFNFADLTGENGPLKSSFPAIFEMLSSVSIGNNYFDDGISSIYYLRINTRAERVPIN